MSRLDKAVGAPHFCRIFEKDQRSCRGCVWFSSGEECTLPRNVAVLPRSMREQLVKDIFT